MYHQNSHGKQKQINNLQSYSLYDAYCHFDCMTLSVLTFYVVIWYFNEQIFFVFLNIYLYFKQPSNQIINEYSTYVNILICLLMTSSKMLHRRRYMPLSASMCPFLFILDASGYTILDMNNVIQYYELRKLWQSIEVFLAILEVGAVECFLVVIYSEFSEFFFTFIPFDS